MSADYYDKCPVCGAEERLRVYDNGGPYWDDGVLFLDYYAECTECEFKYEIRHRRIDDLTNKPIHNQP